MIAVWFFTHYLKIKINVATKVFEIGKKSNFAGYEENKIYRFVRRNRWNPTWF